MKRIRLKNNLYYAIIRETRCRTKYTEKGLYDGFEYYENRNGCVNVFVVTNLLLTVIK